ncbi:MAG: alpha/beta hydrolase [Xanthobacteraceae bacterium]
MAETQPQFLQIGPDVSSGAARRRIAYLKQDGGSPGLVWLQGFNSDMVSTKASALAAWAAQKGIGLVRFDYSGHGQSEGRFEDGTIGRWAEEARTVFEALTTGPQIVIGSSMGGYLALLLLRRLMVEHPAAAARIKALVLIAPAWDMTERLMWSRFPADTRREILENGVWLRPSQYGDPYPITRRLIEDGRQHLMGAAHFNPGRPIVILHGRLDPDVPFAHSEALMQLIDGQRARLIEVPDGEHRLSRPQDIAQLIALIESVSG